MDRFQRNLKHKHTTLESICQFNILYSCVIQWLFCANMMSKIRKYSPILVSSEISKLENSETKEAVHSSLATHTEAERPALMQPHSC